MAGGCCGGCETDAKVGYGPWRRVLWIALIINAGMFMVEIVAGVAAQSASLRADALDFLGDSANYAISLGVAGMALRWRARSDVQGRIAAHAGHLGADEHAMDGDCRNPAQGGNNGGRRHPGVSGQYAVRCDPVETS